MWSTFKKFKQSFFLLCNRKVLWILKALHGTIEPVKNFRSRIGCLISVSRKWHRVIDRWQRSWWCQWQALSIEQREGTAFMWLIPSRVLGSVCFRSRMSNVPCPPPKYAALQENVQSHYCFLNGCRSCSLHLFNKTRELVACLISTELPLCNRAHISVISKMELTPPPCLHALDWDDSKN